MEPEIAAEAQVFAQLVLSQLLALSAAVLVSKDPLHPYSVSSDGLPKQTNLQNDFDKILKVCFIKDLIVL